MKIRYKITDEPSRSKQGGPCWITIDNVYAKTTWTTVDVEGDSVELKAKVTLRRSTRIDTQRRDETIQLDTLPVVWSLGSPQALEVTLEKAEEQ